MNRPYNFWTGTETRPYTYEKNFSFVLYFIDLPGLDLILRFVHKDMAQEKEILGTEFGPKSNTEKLQKMLLTLGYNTGSCDGQIGFKTRKAVKGFQKDHGLEVNGFANTLTWEKIDKVYSKKISISQGSSAKNIQRALTNAGYDPGPIDGKMGRKTKRAIVKFQKANKLKPDGKVGPKTWEKLSQHL